ncbi:MAG: nucleotidyltransferase family protein [Gemmatimonadales bacterium]|jgi:hypothetical protein
MSAHVDRVAATFITGLEGAAKRSRIAADDPALALGRRFGVGGYVARRRLPGSQYRDEQLVRKLHERLMLDAAGAASAALADGGVPHFFARGAALCGMLYRPGDRELVDLDLFVSPAHAGRAQDLLTGMGYVALPSSEQCGPASLRSSVNLERQGGRSAFEAIAIDLHWGLEPVNRLLPRPGTTIPTSVWDGLVSAGNLPAPSPAQHAALLAHHLAHHDLLHVRGMLDLALLRADGWTGDGSAYEACARELGVLRAARALHRVLVEQFGFEPIEGVRPPPATVRARRLNGALQLERWFAWAGVAEDDEHTRITPRRIGRRMLLLDHVSDARFLAADALFPPREHLRWRWPEHGSSAAAWRRHVRQLAGKLFAR